MTGKSTVMQRESEQAKGRKWQENTDTGEGVREEMCEKNGNKEEWPITNPGQSPRIGRR